MIEVVLPLVTNSIDAILNPFKQRNVFLLIQMIHQILDFDPTHDQLVPLLDKIMIKFERSLMPTSPSQTPLSDLKLLNILLDNFQKISEFFSARKVCSLLWTCLQRNHFLLLQNLDTDSKDTLQNQINGYNLTVIFFQMIFNLLQTKDINVSDEFPPAFHRSMKALVLEQLETSDPENFQQFSLFQYRRSCLISIIRQIVSA
jgi:hypothetical protein